MSHFVILYLLSLCILILAYAETVNQTIDDGFGDSLTHKIPLFNPPLAWDNQTCRGCSIQPDVSKAFNNTFTAITYHPRVMSNASISMEFEGIAIYVFFILPNKQAHGVTTYSAANFTIDGQIVGDFSHIPDRSTHDIYYNQMVFNKTGLTNGTHQLVISITDNNLDIFVNFDYAIYTKLIKNDTSTPLTTVYSSTGSPIASSGILLPSSTSSAAVSATSDSGSIKWTTAILSGTVAGVIVVILGITIYLWYRRRQNYKTGSSLWTRTPAPFKPKTNYEYNGTPLATSDVHVADISPNRYVYKT